MTRLTPEAILTPSGAIEAMMPSPAKSHCLSDNGSSAYYATLADDHEAQRFVDNTRLMACHVEAALRRKRDVALVMAGNGNGGGK